MKSKQSFDVLHVHDGLSKAITLANAIAGIVFVRSRIAALKLRKKRK